MIPNIKRGLGVITKLDWVSQVPVDKDETSVIETTFKQEESTSICELFHHDGVDTLHRALAQSKKIVIEQLEGFQELTIHNKGHIDVTVDIQSSGKDAQLLINIVDKSEQEVISTGLSIIAQENVQGQVAVDIKNKPHTLHLFKQICTTKNDANIVWFTHSDGTKQMILDQKANLVGKGSSIQTISTVTAKENDKFDTAAISHHIGTHTTSDILFKSVVSSATVLARGLVRIDPSASNSKGYQTSNILLLDKKAKAITIPDLEIENKDVECSHGSTISSIDEEKIFYLTSRGVSREKAKELIIEGFIDELYERLGKELQVALRGEIDE